MKRVVICAALLGGYLINGASAAYIVGAHSSEKGFATFSFGADTTAAGGTSVPSAAVGLTGTNSIFAGNGVTAGDTYVFSYTPGVNADNTTFTAGSILGSKTNRPGQGNIATGLTGGVSGTYNVYFTTPSTTGISGGPSNFTITQDGAPIALSANLNDGGTGPDTEPGAAFVGGANNSWYKLGTVKLIAGNTYSVTQAASANTFVSQRAHAVMWELVDAVPEPATFSLAALGLLGMVSFARRKNA